MSVRLPDGTVVRGASLADRREDDDWRDVGLYLDPAWRPIWPAMIIDWPDYGLPVDMERAAEMIADAYKRAYNGDHLEVGCRGGLGRTGTVLACMAVLAGVPSSDAVAWVRAAYHPEAVETTEQAQWVEWFSRWLDRTGTVSVRR